MMDDERCEYENLPTVQTSVPRRSHTKQDIFLRWSHNLASPALHSECIGCNNNRYAAARGQTPARGPGPGPSVQRQSVRGCGTAWTGTAASNSDEPGIHEWKQSTNSETDVLDPAATLSRLITLLTG